MVTISDVVVAYVITQPARALALQQAQRNAPQVLQTEWISRARSASEAKANGALW
jgi:hypothetical protein